MPGNGPPGFKSPNAAALPRGQIITEEKDQEMTHAFDLVVVGSGIAGQTAATSAAEAGLSVVLLEKTENLGGSSAMSGGWFAFSGTEEQAAEDIEDSSELFLQDLLDVGNHLNDRQLLDTYLKNQQDTYRWLKSHGVVFREVEISSGQSARRSHNSAIKEVLATLHRDFTDLGGQTRLNHRATRLIQDDSGRVTGVVTQTPGGEAHFTAAAGVILATGGFSRGQEMLKIFAPEQLAALPYGGKGNTGDGLKMAWRLGAGMADMSFVSGTYGSHPETGEEFHELLTAYYMGAIIVNKNGRRFVDESQDYKTLGRVVLGQPEGLGFEIFDAKVRAMSHRGIPLKDIDTLEDIGHVHKADSLEELAIKAGINPQTLASTVERYNASVAGHQPDEFGRAKLCNGVGDLLPIDTAPFYAYPAKSLMTTTYCGITINPSGQVLDVDGDVIQGLYAIGEVTGGFHGAAYMTGTSLGKGAVFGRVTARHAASLHAAYSSAAS
jgi:fumarate reductase flavoprotein subunit